jgi:hypothetical protein
LGAAAAERLQEVAPPAAVQQLQDGLAEREPRVEILSPAAEAMLPAGPWTLRLQVKDWPLVDGGVLGLGPHLQVRIDDGEPLRLTATETTLPELRPGSHRVTVVAARPWGEAVKSPGAMAQIRLHRTAANPLSLPALGSAQLLSVSPEGAVAAEPLLLDWLLIDTPLQDLREGDASWRLRVTVNGDSFLVDRQTPLWLRGWRPGRNALQLELLDGRGEPLNPPFNSLVREVRLDPSLPRPAWQGPELSPSQLAILLGQAPPPPEPAPGVGAEAAPELEPELESETELEPELELETELELESEPELESGPEPEPELEPDPQAEPVSPAEPDSDRPGTAPSEARSPARDDAMETEMGNGPRAVTPLPPATVEPLPPGSPRALVTP